MLNRGEAVNALKRAIYAGRISPAQAKRVDEMQAVADALSLLANIVMAWNTTQMQAVLDRWANRRQIIPPELIGRIAPTRLEGINLRGVFRFPIERYVDRLLPSQSAVKTGRSPETRFSDNARPHMQGLDHEAHADQMKDVFSALQDTSAPTTLASEVAEAVWQAATDPSSPMRIPAGADAKDARPRLGDQCAAQRIADKSTPSLYISQSGDSSRSFSTRVFSIDKASSMSASVVNRPMVMRRLECASSSLRPSARST